MDIASWPFCGCGYCVMLAVGQSVPEGGEVGSPTARTPEGCVAWVSVTLPLFRASKRVNNIHHVRALLYCGYMPASGLIRA